MSPSLTWNLRERSSFIYRILHILDCSLVCGFLWLLVKLYQVPWSTYYTWLEVVAFVVSFLSFQSFQLYRSWRGWKYYLEFIVIVKAWGTVVGTVLFYFFIFKISEAYSRVVFLAWSLATPFLIFISHLIVRKMLRRFRTQGKNIRHAVIAGAGDLGMRMLHQLEAIPWAGIDVVGFFDDKEETRRNPEEQKKPLLGKIEEIADYLRKHDIDYVYIALPMRAEKKIFTILKDCRDLGAQIFLIPDLYAFGLHHAEIQSLGNMLILSFNPDSSWKRTFDVIFSIIVLLAAFPFLLVIALLIKLDSRGPVFYRHRRITATGREFECLKFRTMVVDADRQLDAILASDPQLKSEWERTYKLKNDPRVTRIGRFLRRSSLDEFPQFFNVLKGEMSVVGARPIMGKELADYYKGKDLESAGRYCSMKPGITGPWQVMKRTDIEDYHERIELDDWYILNYSFFNDIKIIWKTVVCVFTGKGAY
ncbi:MAG: sugar transferase [Desulfobulbaceae bacterium]|nr:sugar transferase [Desulfobulbaceae bacterium]